MISIADLTEKFGPSMPIAPWGDCLAIQGTQFNPDWEADLGDQGFRCHFGTLDNHAVMFVQLKKSVAPGKVVYVPPAAAKVVSSNVVNELENQTVVKKASDFKGCQKGPDWGEIETGRLLERWASLGDLPKEQKARKLSEDPDFVGRSANAILQKVGKLQKAKKAAAEVKPVDPDANERFIDERKSEEAWKETIKGKKSEDLSKVKPFRINEADVLLGLAKNIVALTENYSELKKSYVELQQDFEAYVKMTSEISEADRKEIAELNRGLVTLRNVIAKHKHSESSGEAMLPMEASK